MKELFLVEINFGGLVKRIKFERKCILPGLKNTECLEYDFGAINISCQNARKI